MLWKAQMYRWLMRSYVRNAVTYIWLIKGSRWKHTRDTMTSWLDILETANAFKLGCIKKKSKEEASFIHMNCLHATNTTFGSPQSYFLWSRWPTSCWFLSPMSTINQFNYIFPQLSQFDLPDESICYECVWEKGLIDDLIMVMHSVAVLQKLPHSSEASFIKMFLDSYLNLVLIFEDVLTFIRRWAVKAFLLQVMRNPSVTLWCPLIWAITNLGFSHK